MKKDVLKEILTWSTKQPAWQRDALRRLFTAGRLTATDLDDLIDLCKADEGLVDPHAADVLKEEHLAIAEATSAAVSLRSVKHHSGVNALAAEQTITFGPRLTIVYGQNTAGKSGYTRILKRACRSRFAEKVLGNVLADEAPLTAQATIGYRVGDEDKTAPWSPDVAPVGPLAAVSVFDAKCAPVYVRERTDVAFRPMSLDVFDALSAACDKLRRVLEAERTELLRNAPELPTVSEGTRVATVLGSITVMTKPDDVRNLATLLEEEKATLQKLQARRRDLQASDPKKRARELDQRASRVELIVKHVSGLNELFGDAGLKALSEARQKLNEAKTVLDKLKKNVLTPDLLPATGDEAWRKMWDAASAYAEHAYPEGDFPVLIDGGKCVLCQQPIGADAGMRFQHFQEFVSTTAQADVRAAQATHESKLNSVTQFATNRDDVDLALEELSADDPALSMSTQEFIGGAERMKAAISGAMSSSAPLPTAALAGSPVEELRSAVQALRQRAAELRKESPTMDPKDSAALAELEARMTLKEHLDSVLDLIEQKQRSAAYGHCIEKTNTHSVTNKSTELTKRLVTQRLQDQFKSELEKLEFTHLTVEIISAGGAKGSLYHQLAFKNAPNIEVAKVLSDGESRALSLASFLAELTTAPEPSAIIFDDPVSSLDHIWREKIARRLVEEAKVRQVIVFTHDLVFLRSLMKECSDQDVERGHQYVRREGSSAGVSSPDLPWVAMPLKDRIGRLRVLWQQAEKIHRTEGDDAYEKEARDIYSKLRESWEQAIEEILLNDVIERYRPTIETQRLRYLHDITEADCKTVEKAMSECSRWTGHDRAAAEGGTFPSPDDLKKLIDHLEKWSKEVKNRRHGRK